MLVDPKFPHNVGAAVRAASCYGLSQVWFTGDRVQLVGERRFRLPREERMRGYQDVELCHSDQPFDAFDTAVPVAVELRRNAELLIDFEHPDEAVYVFGPEDGSLDRAVLGLCHRFVVIPTRHCTNLAAAVYTVLYDRHAKPVRAGLEDPHTVVGPASTNPTTWPNPSACGSQPPTSATRARSLGRDLRGHTWCDQCRVER